MEAVRVPFVDLQAQYSAIGDQVDAAMQKVLTRGDFILGEAVTQFEHEFAAYCGTTYAIGVDSGTSALELALRALEIGPGDEVITVANTFIASVLGITSVGATPVLVDMNPDTFNIDVEAIEATITPRTKALIPVHLYGQMADMDLIMAIAARHGLAVVEDACQAHGASYKGRRAGSIGHVAAFSFYPAKNLGAYGDGGMVVTSDPKIDAKIRMLRNYGQSEKYHHVTLGFNRRLDTLQAAVLRVKLPYLDEWNQQRQDHAAHYSDLLDDVWVDVPAVLNGATPVWHLYVIRVDDRDGLHDYLTEHGVSTGIHYPIPVHLQPALSALGYKRGDFPITEQAADHILSLPMYAELTESAVEQVASLVNRFNPR